MENFQRKLLLLVCTLMIFLVNLSAHEDCVPVEGWPVKMNICGWKICAVDIDTETLFLCRKDFAKHQDFTSEDVLGDIILSSDDLDSEWIWGSRFIGEVIFDNCDRFEVAYMGASDWSSSKKKRSDEDNLFSVFSEFGGEEGNISTDTDSAFLHRIKYNSKFHSVEANYRNYLTIFEVPSRCCIDGCYLFGYRYFNLDESFKYETETLEGSMEYKVDACNRMHGAQIGGDIWFPCSRCIDIGLEVKGVVFLNRSEQETEIEAEALLAPIEEKRSKNRFAWGAEGSVKASYEITRNCFFRAGYMVLYLENIALGIENFNSDNPFDEIPRSKKLDIDGRLLYHGVTVGFDWCW